MNQVSYCSSRKGLDEVFQQLLNYEDIFSPLALGDTISVITDTDKLNRLLLKKDFFKAFCL